MPNLDNLHLTNPADAAVAKNLNTALLTPLHNLLNFARIKADLSPNDERFLSILKDSGAATQNTDSLLFTLTRWEPSSLDALLARFSNPVGALGLPLISGQTYSRLTLAAGLPQALEPGSSVILSYGASPVGLVERLIVEVPGAKEGDIDIPLVTFTALDDYGVNTSVAQYDLAHLANFHRAYDAYALVKKLGVPASVLIRTATNEPDAASVRDLQAALRARYDAADWRDIVRTINDEMRSLQRDALVAYILHQMRSNPDSVHIDTADKLFEYFLMDVQMDPCMQTSRIRHALSSVQLFIERCLMNLEPHVSPTAIEAKQWAWMKRYRVWEANRKVYLFPENWLIPELRDDKSPFFREIESELLQSDITEDRAATALLNYLSKLEEVAKLEPCGIYHIPDPAKPTGGIDHVVARTAGANRKYYYRRYEYGYWTPWEQIKLDIEDNPVIPVVWNDRLFLFWLRILKEGPDTVQKPFSAEGSLNSLTASNIKTDPPKVTVKAMLCWSEYYNGKWQPTRTSDIAHPLNLPETKLGDFDRSNLKLSVLFWPEGVQPKVALRIIVSTESGYYSFFLHNAYSMPEQREGKKESHFPSKRTLETTTAIFKVSYS